MNARIADQVTARVAGRRSAENPCKWASRTVCGTMLEPDSRPARGCKRARARARDYARATRRACAREGGQRAPAGVSEERDSNVFGRGDVPGSTMTQGRVASRTPRTLPTTRPLANYRGVKNPVAMTVKPSPASPVQVMRFFNPGLLSNAQTCRSRQ